MRAGAVLGAYRVIQQIGAGGMGSVWIAEHTMLGRRAALKVLHPEMSERGDIVRRFFNEARAATAIPDPGIVQVFDFGHADDGSAYIVMELLEGEVLDKRIQRAAIDIPQALRLMRQAASTLGAAHARGIVHRDVKPDNIFIIKDPEVTGGERVKILDFGIAKLNDDRRTAGFRIPDHGAPGAASSGVLGTPLFMSPEQCQARAVDARADVYALGCVLFQLLTGRYPFDADDPDALVMQHLMAPIPLPSTFARTIPRELDAIVARCLAKSPTERYADGKELAAALAELTGSTTDPSTRAASAPIIGPAAAPTLRAVVEPYNQPTVAIAAQDPRKITTLSRATGSGATGEGKRRSNMWLALSACFAVAVGVAGSIVWRGTRERDEVKVPAPIANTAPTVTMQATQPTPPTPTLAPTPTPTPTPTPDPTPAPEPTPPVITETNPVIAPVVTKTKPVDKKVVEKKIIPKTKTKPHPTTTPTTTQTQTKKPPQLPPDSGIKLDENGVPVHR